MKSFKVTDSPNCWVILAKRQYLFPLLLYGKLNLESVVHPNTNRMVEALETGSYKEMCEALGNVLERVTMERHPEVVMLKEQMKKFGADAVLMSGSGPTVFGLVEHESQVPRIYNGLKGFCQEVHAIRMIGERHSLA